MLSAFVLTSAMIIFTHERLPFDVPRLPDIFLDMIPGAYREWCTELISLTELYLSLQTTTFLVLVILHRERELIIRRFMFMVGVLYLIRSVGFTATTLPPTAPRSISIRKFCSTPKLDQSLDNAHYVEQVVRRLFKILGSMGMINQNNIHLCGDTFFSGHTLMILLVHLFIETYFLRDSTRGRPYMRILSQLHAILSAVAIVVILIAQHHYTIDIIGAYYIVTQLFWTYHSLCLNDETLAAMSKYATSEHHPMGFGHNDLNDHHNGERCGRFLRGVVKFYQCLRKCWWWPMFVVFELSNRPEPNRPYHTLDIFPLGSATDHGQQQQQQQQSKTPDVIDLQIIHGIDDKNDQY